MAAHIDRLCSKAAPVNFTRDCVIAVTMESGYKPKKSGFYLDTLRLVFRK